MSEEKKLPELEIDLSAISAERAKNLAMRLKHYAPQIFEVVKMDKQDVEFCYSVTLNQYSEDRWITLINETGENLPDDTFKAGYRTACDVLREILMEYVYDIQIKAREENDNER